MSIPFVVSKELGLSPSHTKKLIKRLRQAGGSYGSLFYRHTHPAPNRLPESVRDKVVALKRENRGRSNSFIADLLYNEAGVRIHPIQCVTSSLRGANTPVLTAGDLPAALRMRLVILSI